MSPAGRLANPKRNASLLADRAWFAFAACRNIDPNLFVPESDVDDEGKVRRGPRAAKEARIEQAKAICRECGVSDDCLEFAIAYGEDGIWGGMTTRQRQSEVKRRKEAERQRRVQLALQQREAGLMGSWRDQYLNIASSLK